MGEEGGRSAARHAGRAGPFPGSPGRPPRPWPWLPTPTSDCSLVLPASPKTPHPAQQAAELLAGGFACHTSSDHSAGSPLPPSHGKGEEQEVKPRDVFASSDGCETGETGERLHPILRLGWRPLCSVTCNGLHGEFLGGHDKEMFIRCTSEPYRDLPLIDVGSVRRRRRRRMFREGGLPGRVGGAWAARGCLPRRNSRTGRADVQDPTPPFPSRRQCRAAAS